jgi:KaiC/GvpD/RAD55 family RecA-like ATPase
MAEIRVPLGFGGIDVPLGSHLAFFYRNLDQLRALTVPFIEEGLEQGDRCTCVVCEESKEGLQGIWQRHGIDVKAALASGQLSMLSAEESYLAPGCFSPEKMIESYEAALHTAMVEGYKVIRIIGEMSWALQEKPGVERLMEYEAKVHKMLIRYPQVTICAYNITRFRGDTIMDALRVHPVCIVGGVLIVNHFYIDPDEFLRELQARNR